MSNDLAGLVVEEVDAEERDVDCGDRDLLSTRLGRFSLSTAISAAVRLAFSASIFALLSFNNFAAASAAW